jgi:hypothetical protein
MADWLIGTMVDWIIGRLEYWGNGIQIKTLPTE